MKYIKCSRCGGDTGLHFNAEHTETAVCSKCDINKWSESIVNFLGQAVRQRDKREAEEESKTSTKH